MRFVRWCLCVALLAACAAARADEKPAVKAAYSDEGLRSLHVGGTERLADGTLRLARAVLRRADKTVYEADKKRVETSRDGPRVRIRYAWGSVSCTYAADAGRLGLTIAVENASKDTIHEIWLCPLSLRLGGKAVQLPRARDNIGSPSVLPVRYDGGVLALCNEEIDRPLRLGFDRPQKGAIPVTVRGGGDRMVYDELYMRRPIAPGGRDTYRVSLRFGRAGTDPHDLADDIYRRYAAKHPPLLNWPDRRPIVRLFVSGGLPAETVLAYYRGGEKGPLPTADEAFRQGVLKKLDAPLRAAKRVDAQGIIVWDIEGDAMPHPTTYIGDPRLMKVLNPRMDAVADAYFRKIRDANLRCGVCIRPSHVVYAKEQDRMMQSFGAAKDPFLELDAKVAYCKKRWGCTLFYVDTNYFWRPRGKGGKWTAGMLAADVWRRLATKHPKVLFVPEHNYVAYWATTAPYNELDCGYRGIPAWVRRVYPKAFCVPVIEDADPHENHDLLVQMVRDGDCLMTFLYGMTRNAEAMINIHAEAKILDAGEPKDVAGAGADKLIRLVTGADLRGRFHAARRLGAHNAPKVIDALIARLEDPKEHWLVQKNAVQSLGRLRARKAVDVLGRLLKARGGHLKHFATLALKELSKTVTPAGLKGLTDEEPKVEPLKTP